MKITDELFQQIAETAYAEFAAVRAGQGDTLPNYANLEQDVRVRFDGEVYAWVAKFRNKQEWELADTNALAGVVWQVMSRLLGAPDLALAIRAGITLDPADAAVMVIAKEILTPAPPPQPAVPNKPEGSSDGDSQDVQAAVQEGKRTARGKNR
jgi:hypothetical protein